MDQVDDPDQDLTRNIVCPLGNPIELTYALQAGYRVIGQSAGSAGAIVYTVTKL